MLLRWYLGESWGFEESVEINKITKKAQYASGFMGLGAFADGREEGEWLLWYSKSIVYDR